MKFKYLVCIIFFSTFLFGLGQLNAQNEYYEHKQDSLKQLIDKFSGNEQKLVRLMNEYTRICFVNRDFENGFLTLNEAKILTDQLNYKEGEVMYYLTLSSFYDDDEEPIRIYYRKKAQWLSNDIEEELDNNSNFTNIPEYTLRNEPQNLINDLNKVLARSELLDNNEILGNINYVLATANFMVDNLDTARSKLTEAIDLFSKTKDIYAVFYLSGIKMTTLYALGEVEEAKAIELELIKSLAEERGKNHLGLIQSTMANNYRLQGRWSLAIEYYLKTLELLDPIEDQELRIIDQYNLAICYENYGMNRRAVDNYRSAITALAKTKDSVDIYRAYGTIMFPLIAIEEYDEAKKYMQLSLKDTIRNKDYAIARYNDAEGQILKNQGKYEEAIPYFQKAEMGFSKLNGVSWAIAFINLYQAECYFQIKNYEKALQNATETLNLNSNDLATEKATLLLSKIYEQLGNTDQAYKYLKDHQSLKLEKEKSEETNRIADAEMRSILDESEKAINLLEKEKLEKEKESLFQRSLIIGVLIVLIFVVLLTIFLYRNNKNKQKANVLLKKQKEKIELTLNQLKATQSQLIQSEKMASLGELTAGIAHEIQNPLNFVNNFSELNQELIDEMQEEIEKGNFNDIKTLSNDIKRNELKIAEHGKRADSIVKGMLEHSRTSSGAKVLTDINTLIDEYVRLSYHGLRAKDKSFQSDYKLDLDQHIPKIKVVPQDMGRVFLNIINNAFYAVNEKRRNSAENYDPKITIHTTIKNSLDEEKGNVSDKLVITIHDNGNGISDQVVDKIFQPFFTTKPTGQGTGLGLSLSYDIVKAHNGKLLVETKLGEGTEFTIILPLKDINKKIPHLS